MKEGSESAQTVADLHRLAVDDLAGGDHVLKHKAALGALVQRDRIQLALDLRT